MARHASIRMIHPPSPPSARASDAKFTTKMIESLKPILIIVSTNDATLENEVRSSLWCCGWMRTAPDDEEDKGKPLQAPASPCKRGDLLANTGGLKVTKLRQYYNSDNQNYLVSVSPSERMPIIYCMSRSVDLSTHAPNTQRLLFSELLEPISILL